MDFARFLEHSGAVVLVCVFLAAAVGATLLLATQANDR
jgi:hypothetical protein